MALTDDSSLPARGAWIEISYLNDTTKYSPCRSPRGERGLKWLRCWHLTHGIKSLPARGAWIEIHNHLYTWNAGSVAPREGSVD